MTIRERIERERNNTEYMYLYSDGGLFGYLYDRSAYVFYTRFKSFKVHVRKLKDMDAPYLYLGFPIAEKDKYIPCSDFVREELKKGYAFKLKLDFPIGITNYERWKNDIISKNMSACNSSKMENLPTKDTNNKQRKSKNGLCRELVNKLENRGKVFIENGNIEKLISEILSLNIANMTPMETMRYLNDLQKELKRLPEEEISQYK